jgi:2-dehydro-3-deoxy-D-gluconate 5-dehydrogenase
MSGTTMDLSSQKALVVGAGRGIGRAIAERFAAAGADVIGVDLSLDRLEAVGEAVRGLGRDFHPIAQDIAEIEKLAGVVDEAFQWGKRLDILVNNAAVIGQTFPPDVTPEDWEALFAVNLRAPFFLSQEAAKRMLAGGGGSIINIATVAAEVTASAQVPYEATKAGMLQMTRGLASVWAPTVRVNAVSPSFVQTELNASWLGDPAVSGWALGRTPLGRFGTVEEIASTVLFLASSAASYVTGENLHVDGGFLCRA